MYTTVCDLVTFGDPIIDSAVIFHCRNADVLPACQLTLKNLQLDYLDLYLMHWPVALKKGSVISGLTDDDQLGYDHERVVKTWSVSANICDVICSYFMCVFHSISITGFHLKKFFGWGSGGMPLQKFLHV